MSAPSIISGRAFVFGDDISTDLLAPGRYMKLPARELASHCLEAIDPAFAASVTTSDILVAGHNFGIGSSREQAAISLKLLGIGAVLARSFARIFFRNAVNIGLPARQFSQADEIANGDPLQVDLANWRIENLRSGRAWLIEALPDHVMAIVEDGGLIPHLKRRLAGAGSKDARSP